MEKLMPKLTTEYLDLKDIKIAFKQYGEGITLLLLHGNSGSKENFSKYQKDYFNMYHSIALDSRGHGQSSSNDRKLSIEQFSNDVISFCEKKEIKSAYVIGYSDGGNISLFLGSKAPHIFKKIIAISPNYLSSGLEKFTLRIAKILKRLLIILGYTGINTLNFIMKLDLILKDIGISEDKLKGIQTEMKILYAEKDLIKREHIEKLVELIPGCSSQMIKSSNHLTILNNKEAIKCISKYLS